MAEETGTDVQLRGKSGETYAGRIYAEKDARTSLSGKSIVCLTNSSFSDGQWHHRMNSIFSSDDLQNTLEHFKMRDDISHLILISQDANGSHPRDEVDDLIRAYLHG